MKQHYHPAHVAKLKIRPYRFDESLNANSEACLQDKLLSYLITCGVCNNHEAVAYYSKEYRGYIGECFTCDSQWKMS